VRVTGTYRITATPQQVFRALTDPAILQTCIPGCERLTQTAAGTYEAELRLGIGPFKGEYRGTAQVTDAREGEALVLRVDGKGAGGFVRGEARLRLAGTDGGTDVTCEADGQVGGVVAAVGSRLVGATAKQMMDTFFRQLALELTRAV
jgi:hypothetical protein